ncbi:pep2 domain protein, partial [Mycobacterium kansasii]
MNAAPHVSDAEQSNTSVIFDRRAIFKVFRRVSSGISPDIELNRVLGRPVTARSTVAGDLRDGRADAGSSAAGEQACPLGMVTEFASNAAEGWAMAPPASAICSPRATCMPTKSAETSPASLTGSVRRLRRCTPPWPIAWERPGAIPGGHRAGAAVVDRGGGSGAGGYAATIEERIQKLAGETITVQRIHGDLHLG